ncbi:MAG: lysylphosphatidylglycerol synthase transmembrane domain-containing protein [Gemmatimonadetes bacterium]|nr:lysylphosphatidylglycerol synthase transmembrane domain-containing protein [Gemmatimonadota bacterium]MDA1104225.1 lysylphosphatidylglycerol synthase transmembrane domain-containing protein [Gemmatimonadota bacterium]
MKHWGKALLGIVITVVLLWWVLADVPFGDVVANIRRGNFLLLAASVFVATFGFLIRALRWKVLLTPILPNTRLRSRFAAVSIGFMANNVLPARVGEFARAYSFSRLEPVSATAAFGTLVVERFMDGVILLLFLVVPVLLPGFPASEALSGGSGLALFRFAIGAVLMVLMVLVVMAVMPQIFVSIAKRVSGVLPASVGDRFVQGLQGFLDSVAIMRDPKLLAVGFAWSLFFWTWHGLSFWLGMLAFGIDTGFVSAIFTEAVVGFGVAVPSAPGFFGTFHFAANFALTTVYGVPEAQSLAFAFAYHFGGWIPITVIGLGYAWALGLSLGEVGHADERLDADEPPAP